MILSSVLVLALLSIPIAIALRYGGLWTLLPGAGFSEGGYRDGARAVGPARVPRFLLATSACAAVTGVLVALPMIVLLGVLSVYVVTAEDEVGPSILLAVLVSPICAAVIAVGVDMLRHGLELARPKPLDAARGNRVVLTTRFLAGVTALAAVVRFDREPATSIVWLSIALALVVVGQLCAAARVKHVATLARAALDFGT